MLLLLNSLTMPLLTGLLRITKQWIFIPSPVMIRKGRSNNTCNFKSHTATLDFILKCTILIYSDISCFLMFSWLLFVWQVCMLRPSRSRHSTPASYRSCLWVVALPIAMCSYPRPWGCTGCSGVTTDGFGRVERHRSNNPSIWFIHLDPFKIRRDLRGHVLTCWMVGL